MSRRTVLDGALERLVNFDDAPPLAQGWWALAAGRIVDEETDAPVAGRVTTPAARLGVSATSRPDGAFALVGRPWLAYPPLNAASYTLGATITAAGYLDANIDITLPSVHRHLTAPAAVGTALLELDSVANLAAGQVLAIGPLGGDERARIRHLGPAAFQVTLDGNLRLPHAIGDVVVADAWRTIDAGVVALRREPTVLRGRTVRHDSTTNTVTPVAGATIAVSDFWTSLTDWRTSPIEGRMKDPILPNRMFLAAIAPGATTARAVGPSQAAERDLTGPLPPGDRLLGAAAAAGSTTIRVSDRSLIAPTDILLVDAGRPDVSELVTVTAVTGYAPPDGPGDVQLALPLRAAHPAEARVIRFTPGAGHAAANLRRDVRGGDCVLFVDDLTMLPDGANVEITGGLPGRELQRLRRLEATSDAAGYFALPPLHRVAALKLEAVAPPLATVELEVRPDYTVREHQLDIVFV